MVLKKRDSLHLCLLYELRKLIERLALQFDPVPVQCSSCFVYIASVFACILVHKVHDVISTFVVLVFACTELPETRFKLFKCLNCWASTVAVLPFRQEVYHSFDVSVALILDNSRRCGGGSGSCLQESSCRYNPAAVMIRICSNAFLNLCRSIARFYLTGMHSIDRCVAMGIDSTLQGVQTSFNADLVRFLAHSVSFMVGSHSINGL